MVLVVPSVCRFAVEANIDTEPVVNILDFEIDTTGSSLSREEEIADCAGNIINSWVEHVIPLLGSQYQLDSVSWVDLNSATGSTGTRSSTSEHTLPVVGGLTGQIIPNNTAVLVTKQTLSARGSRNGRSYIPALLETDATHTEITPADQATWQTAFDALLTELNDEPGPSNVRTLAVVHTTGPNPTTGTHSNVDRLFVEARLATQRRRLR